MFCLFLLSGSLSTLPAHTLYITDSSCSPEEGTEASPWPVGDGGLLLLHYRRIYLLYYDTAQLR